MIALVAPIPVLLLFLGLASTLARGQSGWVFWARSRRFSPPFRLGVLWVPAPAPLARSPGPLGDPIDPGALAGRDAAASQSSLRPPGAALVASVLVTIGSGLWAAWRRSPYGARSGGGTKPELQLHRPKSVRYTRSPTDTNIAWRVPSSEWPLILIVCPGE